MKKAMKRFMTFLSLLLVGLLLSRSERVSAECSGTVGYLHITCLGSTSWCVIPHPEDPKVCVGDHAIITEEEEDGEG